MVIVVDELRGELRQELRQTVLETKRESEDQSKRHLEKLSPRAAGWLPASRARLELSYARNCVAHDVRMTILVFSQEVLPDRQEINRLDQ